MSGSIISFIQISKMCQQRIKSVLILIFCSESVSIQKTDCQQSNTFPYLVPDKMLPSMQSKLSLKSRMGSLSVEFPLSLIHVYTKFPLQMVKQN